MSDQKQDSRKLVTILVDMAGVFIACTAVVISVSAIYQTQALAKSTAARDTHELVSTQVSKVGSILASMQSSRMSFESYAEQATRIDNMRYMALLEIELLESITPDRYRDAFEFKNMADAIGGVYKGRYEHVILKSPAHKHQWQGLIERVKATTHDDALKAYTKIANLGWKSFVKLSRQGLDAMLEQPN